MTAPRDPRLARTPQRRARRALSALAVAWVAACGGGGGDTGTPTGPTPPTSSGARNAVATSGFAFTPATITIAPGDSVTWAFGAVAHTVTFDTPGAPAGVPSTTGASVARVFPQAGTFAYHCAIHPAMTGEVHVQ